jgi:hypothetical protein
LGPATIITTIATKEADRGIITAMRAITSDLARVPIVAITIDKSGSG